MALVTVAVAATTVIWSPSWQKPLPFPLPLLLLLQLLLLLPLVATQAANCAIGARIN